MAGARARRGRKGRKGPQGPHITVNGLRGVSRLNHWGVMLMVSDRQSLVTHASYGFIPKAVMESDVRQPSALPFDLAVMRVCQPLKDLFDDREHRFVDPRDRGILRKVDPLVAGLGKTYAGVDGWQFVA